MMKYVCFFYLPLLLFALTHAIVFSMEILSLLTNMRFLVARCDLQNLQCIFIPFFLRLEKSFRFISMSSGKIIRNKKTDPPIIAAKYKQGQSQHSTTPKFQHQFRTQLMIFEL